MLRRSNENATLSDRFSLIIRWCVTLSTLLIISIYQLGNSASPAGFLEPEPVVAIERGPWSDGEYFGQAEGYGGIVKIRLLIELGWIKEIKVTEALGEDKPYLRDAKKIIPKVIKNQHTDLDAISGATTTCWAILDAVDLALKEAVNE